MMCVVTKISALAMLLALEHLQSDIELNQLGLLTKLLAGQSPPTA